MKAEIRILTEEEYPLWDDFVLKNPRGTIFHTTMWLSLSEQPFSIYGYWKGGELFAGIPLVYSTSLKAKIAAQPSLTPYSGILFQDRENKYVKAISENKEASTSLAKRIKQDFDSTVIHFTPGDFDLQPFIWEGFTPGIRYTYRLDFSNDLETIWSCMDDKRRNDIRKAQKDGIQVIISDDFNQTVNLVNNTFDRQSIQPQFQQLAYRQYESLALTNQCKSFIAIDKNNEPIAVVYIVWDTSTAYYLLGGYNSEKAHHGASALAMWEAIKYAKEEINVKVFDFEGSMIPQIEQFFRKFGGVQIPYYIVKHTNTVTKGLMYSRIIFSRTMKNIKKIIMPR